MKTSWRDLCKTSWRCLEDVLKTSWRRLEDVWPRRIYWSWPRRLEDVLKTSSEDVRLRRTYSSWWRRLEDVFWRRRRKTSSARRMFTGKLCLKRNSNTGAFLWILWIIQEYYFVKNLRTASSERPVQESLFNKVASLTAWRPLTVLERDCSTGISLWILWNF